MRLIECEITCRKCFHRNVMRWEEIPAIAQCESCGKELASFKVSDYRGYIYILSNPVLIDQYKIGKTERSPLERALEMSSGTGVPAPFEVEAYFYSVNPDEDEKKIHQSLAKHRTNPLREFFSGPFQEIFSVCRSVTRLDPVMLRAGSINLEMYDPWQKIRTRLGKPAWKSTKRVAKAVDNNFICIDCGNTMRPVKKLLTDRGVFRGCIRCGFFVDKSGSEVSPR